MCSPCYNAKREVSMFHSFEIQTEINQTSQRRLLTKHVTYGFGHSLCISFLKPIKETFKKTFSRMNIHLMYSELPKYFSRPSPVLRSKYKKSQMHSLSLREYYILKGRVNNKQKPDSRSKAIFLHFCANQLLFCHGGSMHSGKGSALCSFITLVVLSPGSWYCCC